MSKSCAKLVRGRWGGCGVNVHNHTRQLCKALGRQKLSTFASTGSAYLHTQIIHNQKAKTAPVFNAFSAQSTAITTTTTTYIHNKEGKGNPT